jgi:hypothetical protein
MKNIYLVLILMAQVGLTLAQNNPGNFEMRLTEPGGEQGVMRIQIRAIAGVVPTVDDFCTDLSFAIWWDNVANPTIVDLDVVTSATYGENIAEASPLNGNSSGSGAPNGKIVNFSLNNFFQFPTDWVPNEWVTLADVLICAANNCAGGAFPPGITAADFLIQGFTGTLPNMQINTETDYTPTNGPLPLNLISFKARKSGERDAHVTWTTANEENTSHFIVQRSFDKNTWSDVGSVGAAGFSIDIRNYELLDANVNTGRSSRLQVYYRLKMFDIDGRNKLSPIQTVVFNNGTVASVNNYSVYPNPASDGVQVEWDAENTLQPTLLEMYDVTGKLVLQQKVSDNTNQQYIDFGPAKIQAGVYLLRMLNGTEPIAHQQIVVGQSR